MPVLLTDIDDANPQYGIGSFLMIGERTGLSGAANDLTGIDQFHELRYMFESLEIAGNAPGIDVPIVSDTPSDFPSQQGPMDVQNGWTLPGYVEGMEPFFRQLLNDERASTIGQATAPSLTSTESGARDGTGAANAIADGQALTTAGIQGSALIEDTLIDVVGVETSVAALTLVADASSNAIVTINGTDYSDNPFSERITLNGATPVHGKKYFKTITSVGASENVTVDIGPSQNADDRRYTTVLRENADGSLLRGMDVYSRKGLAPNTYREVYLNGMSFSFSREGSTALAFTALGKRPQANTYVDGVLTERQASSLITYQFAKRQAFVGWQAGLFYTDGDTPKRLPIINATFNLANNISFSPTVSGRRSPGGAFRTRRNVTLEGSMEYRAEDKELIRDVLGNEFLEGAYIQTLNVTTGGFPYLNRYDFGRLQFVNLPDAPVPSDGLIERPISLKAVASEDGTRPDVFITVESRGPEVSGSESGIVTLDAIAAA